MSELSNAVFLSYASQDAEAVKRICDALREAGVEVWFDQNELVGGDAWDAKIRKQIADCALFVPMVSAATQARHEGYFRLEWKLAAQRTHMMSGVRAFLIPVVIDGTRDADAHVPEEFRAVQWTRLPGGETPPAFCARVKKLLGGEVAAASSDGGPGVDRAPGQRPTLQQTRPSSRSWLVPAIIGVAAVVALALWQPWRAKDGSTPSVSPAAHTPAVATPPISEARKLVAQARAMVDEGDESNRENYFLADELLKKAQALDATDGEVWAAQAQISADMILHSYDRSRARLENLPVQGQRAIKLAPDSVEAQLGYACHLVVSAYLTADGVNFANEAAQRLEELTHRAPNYHRIYRYLARAKIAAGKIAEALAVCDRANAIGGGDPTALRIKTGQLLYSARYAEAAEVNHQSLALRPTGLALMNEVILELTWHGDLDGAVAALGRWPAWLPLEDRGAFLASQVWLWRHEPEKAIAALTPVPRDFLNDTYFVGPKAALVALAHEMAGNSQAARAEWENVKRVAARVAAEERADQRVLVWKAVALARLGETTEAEAIFRQLEQTKALRSEFWSCAAPSALLRIALGHSDEVVAKFDTEWRSNSNKAAAPAPRAALRLNPVFDSIRATPEFQKWMAAAPAPKAKDADANVIAALDPKSVAVLAFANMSADKDNEYFSDGLSEEILDKLAQNPALRVLARTSSFSYKGKNVPISQIGRELNVGTIIDGSVRRAGNQLRITAQLVNAADGTHIWSETFNKELTTADIFAIQDEIAQKIAARLAPNSTPAQITAVAVPTKNLEAYEAYLRGRQSLLSDGRAKTAGFFERATELDPGFALAWAQLARAHAWLYFTGGEVDEQRESALARAAIDQAQRLQPDLPDIHLALAAFRAFVEGDYPSATRELDLLARSRPEDSETCALRGGFELRAGRFPGAIAALQRAVDLDPKNAAALNQLGLSLDFSGRYAEAISVFERAAQTDASGAPLLNRARTLLKWKGDPKAAFADLQGIAAERLLVARSTSSAITFYWTAGDHARALELAELAGWSGTFGQWEYLFGDLLKARIREAMGATEKAQRDYLAVLPQIERTRDAHPRSYRAYLPLAQVYAGLGRKDDALAAVRRSLELHTVGQNAHFAARSSLRVLVDIEARFGLMDEALEVVKQQIAAGWWRRNELLFLTDFIHLQKDPRFRALAEKAPL